MFKVDMYGLDKGSSFKVWSIGVMDTAEGGQITITHGKEGGKLSTKMELVTAGKQGRNPAEQALFQAQARIKKQKDKGYREDKNELFNLPVIAMLAKDASGGDANIDYSKGVYLSDKLDGVRCLAHCYYDDQRQHSMIRLESRTGQVYSVPHIEDELIKFMNPGEILDGELYLHGENLQDITSAVKRTDTQEAIDKAFRKMSKDNSVENANEYDHAIKIAVIRDELEFRVFDIASKVYHEVGFAGRLLIMQNYATDRFKDGGKVFLVDYEFAKDEAAMLRLHDDAVSRGFEGIMIRTIDGLYESGKRSTGLWKYKVFKDGEFLIISVTPDKDGHGVFNLLNDIPADDGEFKDFSCVMGSMDDRDEFLRNAHMYVGRYLKVKYQARYAETYKPQFPTGVMVRAGSVVDGVFVPSE